MIQIEKTLPQPWWSSQLQNTKRQKRTILKIFKKTNREQHIIQWKNNKKEVWEKFTSSLNRNTPINQAWNKVGQLKGKDSKDVNNLEVNGTQYKDSKSIAIKIGDTLAEQSLPQKYDSTF